MKKYNLIIVYLLQVLLMGLIFYGINTFADLKNQEIKTAKILACGQTYRYTETQGDKVTISYPMAKEFEDCVNSQ